MAETSPKIETLPEVARHDEVRPEGAWSKPQEVEPTPASPPDEFSDLKAGKENREHGLRDAIQGAFSINELSQILQAVPSIQEGHRKIIGSDIAFLIERANEELERNLDEIIIYTITKEKNQGRRQFGERFNQITQGGDLGIQDKVRALMKERMNERFQGGKREFMVNSVRSVKSLETLCDVIRQFTVVDDKVVRWERDPREAKKDNREIRSIEELVKLIKKADEYVEHLASQNGFSDQEPSDVYKQIGEVLDERWIPRDSGISQKVQQLIFEKVKEKYIDQASSGSQSSEDSEPGLIRRGLSRLRGLFSRRKSRR